jgi:hypothetical protein
MSVTGWDSTQTAIGNKVEKVSGKGLSTNDYTTEEKTKLTGIASGAEVNVPPDWNQATTTAKDFIKNKPSSLPASDVPAWAKASYGIDRPLTTDAQLNGANTVGVYYVAGTSLTTASLPADIVNNYAGGTKDCELINVPHAAGMWGIQILLHHYSNMMFTRTQQSSAWDLWSKITKAEDLATTTIAGLMSAADKTKLDTVAPPRHKSVTIPVASWQGSAAPFTATVSDTDVIDGCYITIWPSISSQDIADEADIYPDISTAVGNFTLSSKQKPSAAIVFKYVIVM